MVVLTSLASAGISGSFSSTFGPFAVSSFFSGSPEASDWTSEVAVVEVVGSEIADVAGPFVDGAAAASSPARRAIGVLTFTFSEPSATRISRTSPSSTASTSMVALSVSISAITWPADTVSPALMCHLVRVPSSIVGDSAGIRMSVTAQAST